MSGHLMNESSIYDLLPVFGLDWMKNEDIWL